MRCALAGIRQRCRIEPAVRCGGSILERKKPAVRNLLLRLRHRYLTLTEEPQALHRVLAALAPPLAIELSALLQAGGHVVPVTHRTAAVYAAAVTAFQLDATTLRDLAEVRDGAPGLDAPDVFEWLLSLLSTLAD